jgi:hypothetical protein
VLFPKNFSQAYTTNGTSPGIVFFLLRWWPTGHEERDHPQVLDIFLALLKVRKAYARDHCAGVNDRYGRLRQ